MKHRTSKSGMTLVEVMVSVFLVAVAASIVYTEMIVSYRILMRSRAKLEAQGMAFDKLWEIYNRSWTDLQANHSIYEAPEDTPTPADSVLSDEGIIRVIIRPDSDQPELVEWWDISVEVWPGQNSPLRVGDDPLAAYYMRRLKGPLGGSN